MSNLKRILLILSVIFILIALGLWGWYFWRQNLVFKPELFTSIVEPPTTVELLPVSPIPILDASTAATVTTIWETATVATTASTSSWSTQLDPTATRVPALPGLTATAALAIDLPSQSTLLSKNAHLPLYPASSLKMMTALVTRQSLPLDQVLTVEPEDLTESNSLGLQAGEQLTVADFLQALLISSSNEAAQVLANHSPQGGDHFLWRMNQLAQELHLDQTHYVTPEGFDHPDQKTTAHDLALLAQKLLEDTYLQDLVSIPRTTISTVDGEIYELVNTNQFLAHRPTITLADGRPVQPRFYGIKTGTTPLAGEVLVTAVQVDGRDILLVVLNSQNRYTDSELLLTWILDHYQWQEYQLPE